MNQPLNDVDRLQTENEVLVRRALTTIDAGLASGKLTHEEAETVREEVLGLHRHSVVKRLEFMADQTAGDVYDLGDGPNGPDLEI